MLPLSVLAHRSRRCGRRRRDMDRDRTTKKAAKMNVERAPTRNCWLRKRHARVPFGRQAVTFSSVNYAGNLLVNGGRMALSLRDVRCDPIANRALNELMHHTAARTRSESEHDRGAGE